MKFRFFFIGFIVLFSFQFVFGANCGGNVSCNCSDNIISNYNLSSNLVCNGNALTISSRTLNCHGFSIIGNHTGSGILIKGYDNINIKNCNIENFSTGINLGSREVLVINGYVGNWVWKYTSNINISSNVFDYNKIGISSTSSKNLIVTKNVFKKNSLDSIHLNAPTTSTIWENDFYDKVPTYNSTKAKSFCKNNTSNIYYNNLKGPLCNCLVPENGLLINSNTKFCKGNYNLKSQMKLFSNVFLNCNNANLLGNKNGGILVEAQNSQIANCKFINFSNAIKYMWIEKRDVNGFPYYVSSKNNSILNSSFISNNNAIYMDTLTFRSQPVEDKAENIHNNSFINNLHNIVDSLSSITNATSNYFGTNNLTTINNSFSNPSKMIFQPFIKASATDYSINKNDIILNNHSIKILINKSNSINNGKLDLEIIKFANNSIINDSILNINDSNKKLISFQKKYSIKSGNEIEVIIDPKNLLNENKLNDFAKKAFFSKVPVFINSHLSPNFFNSEVSKYLKSKLDSVSFTDNISNAKVILNISIINPHNFFNMFSINIKPYVGKINSKMIRDKNIINIYGADIDGVLASLLEFGKNPSSYIFQDNYTHIINSTNIDALQVYDYLHNSLNLAYYKLDNSRFQKIVDDVLFSKMYKVQNLIVPILHNNTKLNYSMIRLIPEKQKLLRNVENANAHPIVLAGGLFSDIDAWKSYGKKLANQGFDVFLIQLTGGKKLECENCFDYNYSFLIKDVFPDYVKSILNLTSSKSIDFIGHSNGARVAVDSLAKGYVNSNIVNSLVTVGVPGSFEGSSFLKTYITTFGGFVNSNLKNRSHVSTLDLFSFNLLNTPNPNEKISTNLWLKYFHWITSSKDVEPGQNLSLKRFLLISGDFFGNNDGIVTIQDEKNIFANIEKKSINSKYFEGNFIHIIMINNKKVQTLITNFLKNKSLS